MNKKLMLRVAAFIEAHPEQHDQDNWWCGTKGCAAGHALVMEGLLDRGQSKRFSPYDYLTDKGRRMLQDHETIGRLAGHVLGLTPRQCTELFYETICDEPVDVPALMREMVKR